MKNNQFKIWVSWGNVNPISEPEMSFVKPEKIHYSVGHDYCVVDTENDLTSNMFKISNIINALFKVNRGECKEFLVTGI